MDTNSIITSVCLLVNQHVYLSSSYSISVCPVTVAFSVSCSACLLACLADICILINLRIAMLFFIFVSLPASNSDRNIANKSYLIWCLAAPDRYELSLYGNSL